MQNYTGSQTAADKVAAQAAIRHTMPGLQAMLQGLQPQAYTQAVHCELEAHLSFLVIPCSPQLSIVTVQGD